MVSNNILAGIGFIGVGMLLIVLGIRKNKRCSCKAFGRITGIKESEDTDDEGFKYYSYSPEFEFEVNGQIYHGIGNTAHSKRKRIQIGGSINVFYNPNKPNEHFTKGGRAILPLLGIVSIIFGAIYIATASNV